MGCPGPEVVSAGGARHGRWSGAWIEAAWRWSGRSAQRSGQVDGRVQGRRSRLAEVQRPGAGPRSAVVIGGGGESAQGSMSLVSPNRSTITARVRSNVLVAVSAAAVLASGISGQGCRLGRSLRSQGVRNGHRGGPAVGEGARGMRSAGRQLASGRRSLVGSVDVGLGSPAGPKSAAVVDGPGRQGSSGGRRCGRAAGEVGPGRRGEAVGDEVQRPGDVVAGVAAARSVRRSAGPQLGSGLGRRAGQRVGMSRAGQWGRLTDVQACRWRAWMGRGMSW